MVVQWWWCSGGGAVGWHGAAALQQQQETHVAVQGGSGRSAQHIQEPARPHLTPAVSTDTSLSATLGQRSGADRALLSSAAGCRPAACCLLAGCWLHW